MAYAIAGKRMLDTDTRYPIPETRISVLLSSKYRLRIACP